MKKTVLLSALIIGLILISKPQKAGAAVTGISASATDTILTYCTLPTTDDFVIYGSLSGSVPTTGDSVTIYLNFDDGWDTTFTIRDYSYGGTSGGYFNADIHHTYTSAGTFTPYFTATSVSSGLYYDYTDYAFTITGSCSTITGVLYLDANGNCVHDLGELYLAYAPVMLVNSTSTADTFLGGWTDDTGFYSITVPDGTYTIVAAPAIHAEWWYWFGYTDSNFTASCPASGTYSLTATGTSTYSENFAFTCTPLTSLDVSAQGYGYCFVPGDTTWLSVSVDDLDWFWDYTCTSLSTTITLTLDSRLTYAGVPPGVTPPTTVSGSTLTWDYSTTADMFSFYSYIYVLTSTSATLGDTICNTVYATPTALTDTDLANNTSNFCGLVRSSYDPNSKEVAPQGFGTPGYIPNNTPLTYNIHFQNTGTAPATNITVVDTLSPNLDARTFHILKSSASCQVQTEGNLVKFSFNGINLPDIGSSRFGSIGSISYAVMPKPDLAPGTPITDKAAIYFDYNPPVWTNATLNTIMTTEATKNVAATSFKASVYPNPADGQVYAVTDDKSDFNINITDMLGRIVVTGKSLNGNAALSTKSLAPGLYIVKLINTYGNELTTKLTVQH